MKIISQKVNHLQFGEGVVTEQTEDHVRVQFAEQFGMKKFLYPAAFERYLTLSSEKLRGQMAAEVCAYREQILVDRQKKGEELAQKREDVRQELIQQKRGARKTAAAETATAKKAAAKKAAAPRKTAASKKSAAKEEAVNL